MTEIKLSMMQVPTAMVPCLQEYFKMLQAGKHDVILLSRLDETTRIISSVAGCAEKDNANDAALMARLLSQAVTKRLRLEDIG